MSVGRPSDVRRTTVGRPVPRPSDVPPDARPTGVRRSERPFAIKQLGKKTFFAAPKASKGVDIRRVVDALLHDASTRVNNLSRRLTGPDRESTNLSVYRDPAANYFHYEFKLNVN